MAGVPFSDQAGVSAKSKISVFILLSIWLFCSCSPAGEARTTQTADTTLPASSVPPTFTSLPTTASPPTATPVPISSPVYYMIALDASRQMTAPFDGQTKWEAAREAAEAILDGLGPDAYYGLVVIGGAPVIRGVDPCNEPSVVSKPFSARDIIGDRIGQLQAVGEGSLYTGFFLAKNQFDGLPASTVRVLIYISGPSDACQSRDEWAQLENLFKVPFGLDQNLYSEIIILDEDTETQTIAGRLNDASTRVDVQAAENMATLRQSYMAVVDRVSNYVNQALASLPTETAEVTSTLELDTATIVASRTLTPNPSTNTPTLTPSLTPSPTPTQPPSVELLSARYLTTGVGCQADIVVRVTGSPATGSFHVWNANPPPEGKADVVITLPVGTYSGNPVTLGGHEPESYFHDVWFEYDGQQSNRLEGLKCPLLPFPTATP